MPQGTITNSTLGRMGYFGNQIFQYMFLKTYALRHDLTIEAPPWIGNYLFGADDPPISRQWPMVRDVDDQVVRQSPDVFRDCDFEGYFQYPTSYYAPQRDQIREWFQPAGEVAEMMRDGWGRIASRGRTFVGLHFRRADFGHAFYYITPSSWYLRWLDEVWPTLDDPVLFIASNDLNSVLPDFASYRPVTCREMQIELPRAPYYPDFFGLTQCDLLAIPNSTFSFAASMIARHARRTARSELPLQAFADFDPWNDEPLHRKHMTEDYPHVPGIAIAKHRQWLRRLKRFIKRLRGAEDIGPS